MDNSWLHNFGGAVTICDIEGTIIYMNKKSQATFASDGGAELVGQNVLDCHPEPACSKLVTMLKTEGLNCYTIEKNGVKKLVYQAPWYKDTGEYGGLVELSLEIPFEMPHYVRQSKGN